MAEIPKISVIMACYAAERTLAAAVESVLAQTVPPLEVIVSDDASPDGSLAVARKLAARDGRVRVLEAAANGGPGAARNRALATARGDWVAIVDCDDLMHPARLSRLVARAEAAGADGAVDDLLSIDQRGRPTGKTLFPKACVPATLSPEALLPEGTEARIDFGYTKPVLRRHVLEGVRYDEAARIGEDYLLLLSLVARGVQIAVDRAPLYLYRRHDQSISHRLSVGHVTDMIESHDRVLGAMAKGALGPRLAVRRDGLVRARDFELLVEALKARDIRAALRFLGQRPALAADLLRAAQEHVAGEDGVPPAPERPVLSAARPAWAAPEAWLPLNPLAAMAERAGAAKEVVAVGVAGAERLGYLPRWRRAHLIADPREAAVLRTVLQPGLTLVPVRDPHTVLKDPLRKGLRELVVSHEMAAALHRPGAAATPHLAAG